MADRQPLATVECVYEARDQFHDDEWAVVVGERIEHTMSKGEAVAVAATINAAHEAVTSKLRGQLSVAMAALKEIDSFFENSRRAESKGSQPYDALFLSSLIRPAVDSAIAALAGACPEKWVPKTALDDMAKVLADLKEEKADVWRERVETALKMLDGGMPAGNQVVKDVLRGLCLAGEP